MMRVKVDKIGKGIHPSEVIVSVKTNDGEERLVVHQRSLQEDSLDIGYPIDENDDQYLIELPRETMTGLWRVWVQKSKVIQITDERVRA
jgi:hypothetical protein